VSITVEMYLTGLTNNITAKICAAAYCLLRTQRAITPHAREDTVILYAKRRQRMPTDRCKAIASVAYTGHVDQRRVKATMTELACKSNSVE